MSNVLIGIIGVILFIGLALAGALFLGPRFQQSTNNSKAAAAIQAVSQISNAANMANVQNGTLAQIATDGSSVTSLQTTGFLKSVPSNPISSAAGDKPILASAGGQASGNASMVIMSIPVASSAVCAAIAKQSGQPDTDVTTGLYGAPARPSGCFMYIDVTYNYFVQNGYYAFSTL